MNVEHGDRVRARVDREQQRVARGEDHLLIGVQHPRVAEIVRAASSGRKPADVLTAQRPVLVAEREDLVGVGRLGVGLDVHGPALRYPSCTRSRRRSGRQGNDADNECTAAHARGAYRWWNISALPSGSAKNAMWQTPVSRMSPWNSPPRCSSAARAAATSSTCSASASALARWPIPIFSPSMMLKVTLAVSTPA